MHSPFQTETLFEREERLAKQRNSENYKKHLETCRKKHAKRKKKKK
jgi:hypothetical protein